VVGLAAAAVAVVGHLSRARGGGDMGQKIVNGFPFLYKRHRTSSARRTSIMESVLSPA
jgi:hypothetical protein